MGEHRVTYNCDETKIHWSEKIQNDALGHNPEPIENFDPKGEEGKKKTPLHLLPPSALATAAWVHKLGADKYEPWNWRHNKVCASTYVGAIKRHLDAWIDGEDNDPESGLTHIAHIIASCNIIIDAGVFGTLVDDRPPKRP